VTLGHHGAPAYIGDEAGQGLADFVEGVLLEEVATFDVISCWFGPVRRRSRALAVRTGGAAGLDDET
jgi:hypothetical protein